MKFFHFDCYALLSVNTYDKDSDGEPEVDHLHGFYRTEFEAKEAAGDLEIQRLDAWKSRRSHWGQSTQRSFYEAEENTIFYAVVPLNHLNAKHFWDIEDLLKKAALLQYQGIGKPIPAEA